MSRSPKLLLHESDQGTILPEINKPKSFSTSPKHSLPGVPLISSQASGIIKQEDLLITQLNNQNKKDRGRVTIKLQKKVSDSSPSKKKNSQLFKILKEKDAYIHQLEIQLSEHQKNYEERYSPKPDPDCQVLVQSDEKIEEKSEAHEYVREVWNRYKSKDFEIFSLKTENDDFKKVLEKISIELYDYKFKVKDLEKNSEKLRKKIEEVQKELEDKSSSTRLLEKKVKEKEMELLYKVDENEDLNKLLKISEDKRRVAVELANNFEKKYFSFKTKQGNFSKQQKESKSNLDNLSKLLQEKEKTIKDLQEKLLHSETSLNEFISEYNSIKTELEMVRLSKKNSTEYLESKVERIEEENKNLKVSIQDAQKFTGRQNSKRSETVINSKYFSRLTSQELTKANSKIFELEEKLMEKNLEIEKLNKDFSYLNKQVHSKDLIMQKMKSKTEEFDGIERGNFVDKGCVSDTPWISFEIRKLIEFCRVLNDGIRCSKCFCCDQGFFSFYPCGHFSCAGCKEGTEICAKCCKKVSIMLPAPYCLEFVEVLAKLKDGLERCEDFVLNLA